MPKLLCIDLGTYSIKTLLMEVAYKKYQMLDFKETVFPENVRSNILEPQSRLFTIREHLEKNFKKIDLQNIKIHTMIPGDKSVVKFLTFPFKEKNKVKNAIPFELENYVPFDLENWLQEHCIQTSNSNESYVVAVLVNKNQIRGFINEFSEVGIEPLKISTDSLVLSNLDSLNIYNENSYAIINIGHSKTNITVIEQGIISLVRSIPVGGFHLTKKITRACNNTFAEAEAKKHREARAFSDEEIKNVKSKDRDFYNAILDFSFDLIQQLRQSLYSLKIQDKGMVTKIYLSGGTAKIRDIGRFIAEELRIPVSDCLIGDLSGNKVGMDFDKNLVPPLFALGINEITNTPVSGINFRKGEFAPQNYNEGKRKFIRKIISYASIGVVLSLSLFFGTCTIRSAKEKNRYKVIATELKAEFPEIYKKIFPNDKIDQRRINRVATIIKEEKNKIDRDLQLLEEVEKTGVSFLDILWSMSTSISNDLKFDIYKMEFANDKVSLEANASNLKRITEIVTSLERNPIFSNVKETETKVAATGSGQDFKLRLDVK